MNPAHDLSTQPISSYLCRFLLKSQTEAEEVYQRLDKQSEPSSDSMEI